MQDNYMAIPRMLDLLEKKGLTEKGLDLDWKPGTIAADVKEQFDLLKKSATTTKPLNMLVAEIPGLFDKGKDQVDFTLTFKYDAQTDKTSLRSVRATMGNDAKKLYLVGNPNKMYSITEMYRQLNQQRSTKALAVYRQIAEKRATHKSIHL